MDSESEDETTGTSVNPGLSTVSGLDGPDKTNKHQANKSPSSEFDFDEDNSVVKKPESSQKQSVIAKGKVDKPQPSTTPGVQPASKQPATDKSQQQKSTESTKTKTAAPVTPVTAPQKLTEETTESAQKKPSPFDFDYGNTGEFDNSSDDDEEDDDLFGNGSNDDELLDGLGY